MDNQNSLPSYKEILIEIGNQINIRKKTLFLRSFLIIFPFLLLFVVLYMLPNFYTINYNNPTNDQIMFVVRYGIPITVLCSLYSIVMNFIFKIEKQIWIDSFFDKKNLTPKESWMIARKLFWPALRFSARIWFIYIFIPVAIAIITIVFTVTASITSFFNFQDNTHSALALFVPILLSLVGISFYFFYIRIKLRYIYFVFLDFYGKNDNYKSIMSEVFKLNDIGKKESFKKSLVATLGTDSLNGIFNITSSIIGGVVSNFGGRVLGGIISMYGKETGRHVADLANISAQYLLYRIARKELYGIEQDINENIYKLR